MRCDIQWKSWLGGRAGGVGGGRTALSGCGSSASSLAALSASQCAAAFLNASVLLASSGLTQSVDAEARTVIVTVVVAQALGWVTPLAQGSQPQGAVGPLIP